MASEAGVDLELLGARVGGEHDRVVRLAARRSVRYRLPQLFSDERNERMGQAQHGFQRADQGPAGAALLGVVTGLDLDLGDFQVPVAELVPDELVDGLGDQVETVVGEVAARLPARRVAAG